MHDSDLLNLSLNQPRSSVPVYCIHSFEQPFCTNPLCPCQQHKPAVLLLFTQIIEGKLELEKAADLSERTV